MPLKQLTLEELETALSEADYMFLDNDKDIDLECFDIDKDDITLSFVAKNGEMYEFACNTSSLRIEADGNDITLTDTDSDSGVAPCQFSLYARTPVFPLTGPLVPA